MPFEIDHDVPRPSRKYPFDKMEPGDSFLLNGEQFTAKVRSSANKYGRLHNCKFSIRMTPDGYRCWRIK